MKTNKSVKTASVTKTLSVNDKVKCVDGRNLRLYKEGIIQEITTTVDSDFIICVEWPDTPYNNLVGNPLLMSMKYKFGDLEKEI